MTPSSLPAAGGRGGTLTTTVTSGACPSRGSSGGNALRVAVTRFTAHRMPREYTERYYVPAMRGTPVPIARRPSEPASARARSVARWRRRRDSPTERPSASCISPPSMRRTRAPEGFAEAVEGIARYQAHAGASTIAVMPLYGSARPLAGRLEPVGEPVHVQLDGREERFRVLTQAERPDGPASIFWSTSVSFDRAGIYGEAGRTIPTTPSAGPSSRARRWPPCPGSRPARSFCTPTTGAHGARARLSAQRPSRESLVRFRADRAVRAQRGIPGPLSGGDVPDARHSAGAVQLAPPRVVRAAERAEGRARVRRRRRHGEPQPRTRAVHAERRLRAPRRVLMARPALRRHLERDRSAHLGPGVGRVHRGPLRR